MKKILFLLSLFVANIVSASEIIVTDAWLRKGSLGGSTALYFNIENKYGHELKVISLSSSSFKNIEMHKTVSDGNIMRMVHVDSIIVPAKTKISLKPGGLHVMIMDLEKDIKVGDTEKFTAKTNFADIEITAVAK